MYEKAVKYKPTETYMYIAKAKVEAQVDVTLAEKTMQQYLQYGKENADYYNELGLIYQEGGDTAKSLIAFRNGIAKDSNYYYPLYNLGMYYYERGQWDSAVKYLSRAHDINPGINYIKYKITDAENNLAEAERIKETEARKQKLLKRIDAGDKEALLEIAEIYYYWYNYDSAHRYYTEYIEHNPDCGDSVYTSYLFSAKSIGYTESWDSYHGNTSPGEIFLTAIGKIGQQALKRKKGPMAYLYIEAVSEQVYQAVLEGDPGYEYTADLAALIAKLYDYSYNQEKALEWLEIALEKGYSAEHAGYYSNFGNLQDNKKYKKLLKKYRKKQGIKETPTEEEWEYNNMR
jgi:Tfp pilus assembly protein PilF